MKRKLGLRSGDVGHGARATWVVLMSRAQTNALDERCCIQNVSHRRCLEPETVTALWLLWADLVWYQLLNEQLASFGESFLKKRLDCCKPTV